MQDETMRNEETVIDNSEYLDAIKNLKANTVDKASYEALKADNRRLLDAVVNGQTIESEVSNEDVPTRLECYKKYKENNFSSDLDYWKNFIDLRNATIREYGKDPLVTGNYGMSPTGEAVEAQYGEPEAMQNLVDTISNMIEECENDPRVFDIKFKALVK